MYYISKYNYYLTVGNKYYIYNTISNRYKEFPPAVFNTLQNADRAAVEIIDANYNSILPATIDSDNIEVLLSLRMIYSSVMHEERLLKMAHDSDVVNTAFSSLIILPNLSCNLNCHYCYEKDKNELMSLDQEKTLTSFLTSEVRNKKWLNIRWSGGEPLLSWNKIKRISQQIIDECNKSGCNYSASIITNGTLLSDDKVDDFLKYSVKAAQITLDGDSSLHDKIRHFKSNGQGTFGIIMKNIGQASKKIKIHLRINVDKNNFVNIPHLFDEIASTHLDRDNVQLFCRPVMCSLARTPNTKLFSPSEFLEIEEHLLKWAKERDLQYSFHRGMGNRSFRCCMNAVEGFYISPDLLLYKCPMYIDYDKRHSVGYIDKDGNMKITNIKEFSFGFKNSPYDEHSKCRRCKVLPICNGECFMQRILSPSDENAGCIPEKKSMAEKMKYAIENSLELHAFNRSSFLEI